MQCLHQGKQQCETLMLGKYKKRTLIYLFKDLADFSYTRYKCEIPIRFNENKYFCCGWCKIINRTLYLGNIIRVIRVMVTKCLWKQCSPFEDFYNYIPITTSANREITYINTVNTCIKETLFYTVGGPLFY